MTSSNPHETFCKNMCLIALYSPFTKITYILTFPPTSLEQFPRGIWNAVSQAEVLILPQIKLNSELSCCAIFFLSQQFYGDRQSDPEWTSLLRLNSTRNRSLVTSRGTSCPPASSGSPANLGKSLLVLGSPILVHNPEFYLAVYNRYLPFQLKDTWGGGGWKIPENTHPVERYWKGVSWKIPGKYQPRWKILGGGACWKVPGFAQL